MDRRHPSPGLWLAAAVLIVGPVVLAFESGGYFDGPRLAALLGAAVILIVLALTAPRGELLPRTAGARAALLGFGLLAAWTALSRARSPLPDVARDDTQRLLLYAAVLGAGSVAWRDRRLARMVEPGVAAGILVVIAYGLAGRWLPGIVHLHATMSAGGRLEQPLTYWNATGMLAAVGAVLCTRVAGDRTRGTALRVTAASGAAPLLCGVYLSFSRGAVAALAAGLIVLMLCAPARAQLRAVAVTLATGVAAALGAAVLPGVRALDGTLAARERDGLVALGITVVAMGVAAAATRRALRGHAAVRPDSVVVVPRAARWVALAVIVAAVVGPVAASRDVGSRNRGNQPAFGASTQRFTTVSSNRYAYWRVAVHTFEAHPVSGVGSGGWGAEWLRRRRIAEGARDAHSIELETLAELGLVGFALLLLAFGGVARCAIAVLGRDPGLVAGSCAGLTVWVAHSALDWDWEMPAVTLPVLTLAGVLIAAAETPDRQPRPPGARAEPTGRVQQLG